MSKQFQIPMRDAEAAEKTPARISKCPPICDDCCEGDGIYFIKGWEVYVCQRCYDLSWFSPLPGPWDEEEPPCYDESDDVVGKPNHAK